MILLFRIDESDKSCYLEQENEVQELDAPYQEMPETSVLDLLCRILHVLIEELGHMS